jgi:hypothetical protein
MAFTDTQKDKVRGHLGYSITSWSMAFIGDRMNAISSISPEAETRISAIISELDAIETQINTFRAANAGTQVKADGTVYFQSQTLSELQINYDMWKKKLAVALDLNYFSQSSQSIIRS